MRTIETKYGVLEGVESASYYPGGAPEDVIISKRCVLRTPYGAFVPRHATDDMRNPRPLPIGFHPDGTLKSLPLQEQAAVRTPIGEFPAELLTFYPSGALRRIFPLNGKLSAFWDQKNELTLASEHELELPTGKTRTRFLGIQFYESGALRSLTLWPMDRLTVPTPLGPIETRIGVAFHESGALRSLEPAQPVEVRTPIGRMVAYDNDPEGIHGDMNSLCFSEDGRLTALSSVNDTVTACCSEGLVLVFAPAHRISPCDDTEHTLTPLRVEFPEHGVRFISATDPEGVTLPIGDECLFTVDTKPLLFGSLSYDCGL